MLDLSPWESKKASKRGLSLRQPICGFGINDATFVIVSTVGGVSAQHPAYSSWKRMISRCYNKKSLELHPTYSGVTVCDEWRSFMAFRSWWIKSYVDGWDLDKDILSDDMIYSPETCIYVPRVINSFITGRSASRSDFPIGASFIEKRRKFQASCGNPYTGKLDNLGWFNDPESAHNAWLSAKLSHALGMMDYMNSIDRRIYPRIVEIIKSR